MTNRPENLRAPGSRAAADATESGSSGLATDPLHSSDRLAALDESGLLDSAPEAFYDRAAKVAAKLLHAPTALVSLVDDHRQFFKSAYGLADPWASARGTPLSHSLCRHAVTSGAPVVIPDAAADPAWREHPAVTDMGIGSYLGVPLVTQDRRALGALCVVDPAPHAWTENDIAVLSELAQKVVRDIDRRRDAQRKDAILQAVLGRPETATLLSGEDGRICAASSSAHASLGYGSEELVGRIAAGLIHTDDIMGLAETSHGKLVFKTDSESRRRRLRTKSGAWQTFLLRTTVYRTSSGGVLWVSIEFSR